MVDGGIAAYREALAMRRLRAVHITNF